MTFRNPKLEKLHIHEFLTLAIFFLLPFYFIKFEYRWISLNLVEILIGALFVAWILNKNIKHQVLFSRYFFPVLLIIVGVISSILVNKNYYIGFGILKGWFLAPMIFAIILHNQLKNENKFLKKIFAAVFFSGVLVSAEGVYFWLSGLVTYDGRLRIFFDSPNQLAMFLAPVFLVGIFFLQRTMQNAEGKINWKNIILKAGLAIIFLNLYLTKSYGVWLAIGLTIISIFWLKYWKTGARTVFSVAVIVLIIFLGVQSYNKLEDIKNLGDRSSLASREAIWKSAGLMIRKNPVFGIGAGNFQDKYLEYQKYFPPYPEWAVPQPHNLYLAFWLESGILGFAGFLWLIYVFFSDNKKARENNLDASLACLAIILYLLIHGIIDTTYWRNDMAVIFWVIIAVNLYLSSEKILPQGDV